MERIRKIIHIDMDAFFASVEQRDNPELRGKPIAVGGNSERGVVAAASYEARKYGVFSAMSSKIAAQKCPGLIFVKPRFEAYKTTSLVIKSIFHEYTDLVEPLSLDEAYLDVTSNKKEMPSATIIAKDIKKRIKEQTDLTASAGISINKFLAKIASDLDKPDGLYLIPPEKAVQFVEDLDIKKIFGIGKVTAQKMHKLGIFKGRDLKEKTLNYLVSRFGKAGRYYYNIARAIDERPVNPSRERKSIGAERTFEKDLHEFPKMMEALVPIAEKVINRMEKGENFGKTITLKIKYFDFQQITRSRTMTHSVKTRDELLDIAQELMETTSELHKPVRLLGLSVANLENDPDELNPGGQLTLAF